MKRTIAAIGILIATAAPSWAGIEDGVAAYVRGDHEAAYRAYRPLAEQGDPSAQFGLGLLYHLGAGVIRDHAEAARWYTEAAWQGEARAQYYLGDMYRKGHGVERDFAAAALWYFDAAEQGSPDAQYALGLMFRGALGVPRDDEEAVMWFRRAAEHGLIRAQVFLAHMIEIGHGVRRDPAEAAEWYRRAAEQGDVTGQRRLAEMYDHGKGVKRDLAEATRWYRRAAEQGDTTAPFFLAVIHFNGEGGKPDPIQAHVWFDLAAARVPAGDIRDEIVRNRKIAALRLNPAEIAEARFLAREWRPVRPPPAPEDRITDVARIRARVSGVQRGLAAIGYGDGKADGFMGRRTRAAIRAFQLLEGLPVTGRITRRLEVALQTAPLPSRPRNGDCAARCAQPRSGSIVADAGM